MSDEYVPPNGLRFSQLYIERGEPVQDSPRLRVRIAAMFEHDFAKYFGSVHSILERRLGVDLGYVGGAHDIAKFLKAGPPRDFLDAVTLIGEAIDQAGMYSSDKRMAQVWVKLSRAAFVEENVAYRLGEDGVVHPLVDPEFRRNLATTLAGLTDPRLLAVRTEVARSVDYLEAAEPDTKGAVRSMFEALEIYAKVLMPFPAQRLDRNVVEHHLLPMMLANPGLDAPGSAATKALTDGLLDWIKAAHIYRHGQNVTEPAPPPLDLAVVLVSTGAAYLRWLVSSTAQNLPAPATSVPEPQAYGSPPPR